MKTKRILALLLTVVLLCAVCLAGCGEEEQPLLEVVVDPIDDNYRVFYELFVGSFSDSNGDGCGDIQGIINRLDYLNDGNINSGKSLGVQGIWLSPIFASPSYHKYDVANYYEIDAKFGTMDDLKKLIDECHKRNVKLIIDLPINHTSSSNLWFTRFVNAHKNADSADEYYDFYTYATTGSIPGGRKFAPIPNCAGQYYECNFDTGMPELNFDNPQVKQAVLDVAEYYLDIGIDGFRFDAIKYVYYGDTAKSVSLWQWYMEQLRAIKSDIYCVGECWSNDTETLQYISAVNCFNFQLAQVEGQIASCAKGGAMGIYTNYVANYTKSIKNVNSDAMMMPFISNHDMDRSAGYLTLATRRMYMAANLYILCSGSPIIYYGEEIGMRGTRGASQTDANRRLAMLWGDGDTVRDPIGTTYSPTKQTNGTVAEHLSYDDSLYNYYCKLIALRNKYPAIARGDYRSLVYSNEYFGGFLVTYDNSTLGIFHNNGINELTIDLSTCTSYNNFSFDTLCDYIGQGQATLVGTVLTIGPQTSAILR